MRKFMPMAAFVAAALCPMAAPRAQTLDETAAYGVAVETCKVLFIDVKDADSLCERAARRMDERFGRHVAMELTRPGSEGSLLAMFILLIDKERTVAQLR